MHAIRKAIAVTAAVSSIAFGAFGEDCYWKTDAEGGSGGWADSTRWKDGKVPQSGDRAYVHGTATLSTEADLVVFERIERVYTEKEGDVFCFAVPRDEYELTTWLDGHGSSRFDNGGIIRLTVSGADSIRYCMLAGMEVLSGTVYLPSDSGTAGLHIGAKLTVRSPATVCVGKSGRLPCGLCGDGAITSPDDGGMNIALTAGTEEVPCVFTGSISGKVQLELAGGYQRLTATDNANTGDFRFRQGTMEVSSFGASGDASSFGTSLVWMQNSGAGKVARLRYLGTGESTTRTFNVNGQPQNEIVIDGGPHGGLDIAGKVSGSNGSQTLLTLDGEGTNAVNQISGTFTDPDSSGATHILKKGAGTWRFPAKSAAYHGVFAVEEGVLEYGSLAAAGTACSLGYANRLYERKSGATSGLTAVPWAYLLGDGVSSADSDTLATFSYVGTDPVDCSTRPIAVKGAARLRNDSAASFRYSGITSAQEGVNSLVLDGTGTMDSVTGITDGVGKMRVVKEGTGIWTVDGANTLGGGVQVKQGKLSLKNTDNYTWYRFTIRKVQDGKNTCKIGHIAFYDKDGNELTTGLTYYGDGAWWHYGDRADLKPAAGTIWYETTKMLMSVNLATTIFGPYAKDAHTDFVRTDYAIYSDETPMAFLFRLPEGSAAPVSYDVITGWYSGSKPYERTMVSWTVSGSTDGLNWTDLDSHDDYATVGKKAGNYWMSDGTVWTDDETHATASGFGVAATFPIPGAPTSLAFIEVGANGVFEAAAPVTVGSIGVDCAEAESGSYRGVKFASTGVIHVRNLTASGMSVRLDCDADAGFANLASWTAVDEKGRELGVAANADTQTLTFVKPGLIILLK